MDWAAKLLGLGPAFLNASGVGGGCLQVNISTFQSLYFPQPGSLQNTASDSALIAVVAARSLYLRNNPGTKLDELVIYTSTQTHSLGLKAGLVLGLPVRALEVKPEEHYSLRGETVREALEEDKRRGRKPFILSKTSPGNQGQRPHYILVATVGTTSSGAIDNLPEIEQVGERRNQKSLSMQDSLTSSYQSARIHPFGFMWMRLGRALPYPVLNSETRLT